MNENSALPTPDENARAHSERLAALIRAEIAARGGAIPFARFMELALYAPGLGYYSAGARKFGEGGDFITAPELSPLFSRCVARACQEVLELFPGADILEAGAGSGAMAAEVLRELDARAAPPRRYRILEVSGDLRARQRETIAQRAPHWLDRVEWLDRLPEAPFRGVVLANEVLDAMPVHRFIVEERGVEELCVAWEEGRFVWRARPPRDETVAAHLRAAREDFALDAGYTSEINLAAGAWLGSIAGVLEAGMILLIDYGFPAREYYHPQRASGTLMCHYRHRAHDDPLILAGLQDITAHVDFTAVARAAVSRGLHVAGYTTQGQFLLASGLLEMAAARQSEDVRAALLTAQQIKKLTLPHEMGELFKVMALTRGVDQPLMGFAGRDMRARL